MAISDGFLPPGAQEMELHREVVTPESLLLDVAERIGRIREGRVAAQVHLSKLSSDMRKTAYLRVAARMFDPLVSGYRCQVFLLSQGDIMVVGRDIPFIDMDATVQRVKALFSRDPLAYAVTDSDDGLDPFVTYYDLEEDYDSFLDVCEGMKRGVDRMRKENLKAPPVPEPMTPEVLDALIAKVGDMPVARFMRRQAAISILNANEAKIGFQEFFLSMGDLRQVLAPRVDILANRWLFQSLTQAVDRQVLKAMRALPLTNLPRHINLNLNVDSVDTEAFDALVRALDDKHDLTVDVQLVDVFSDLDRFFAVRDKLRGMGFSVTLDGMTLEMLDMTDVASLDVDKIKLVWHPHLNEPYHPAMGRPAKELIAEAGSHKFVLTRCDSETAIKWGVMNGILTFQGRLVDAMLGALTKKTCPHGAKCTLAQCTNRRAGIAPQDRKGCYDFSRLDGFPSVDPRTMAG